MLMENFHWTPTQIDEINYSKVQEYFMIINQRRITKEEKSELDAKKKLPVDDDKLKGLRFHKEL